MTKGGRTLAWQATLLINAWWYGMRFKAQAGCCYHDTSNMRYCYPDFVARLKSGEHWLLETKGAETLEVAHKDRAAVLWCENSTALTGISWQYLKVSQKDFEKLQPADFDDLQVLSVGF